MDILKEWPRERGVYRLRSRNLTFGVYSKRSDGFTGIREKFGDRSLFTEYFRQTAWPVEYLGQLPDEITLSETEPGATTTCGGGQGERQVPGCGKRAWWAGPPAPAPWACETGCADVHPVGARMNRAVFDYLDALKGD
jgi:hypothetical protein